MRMRMCAHGARRARAERGGRIARAGGRLARARRARWRAACASPTQAGGARARARGMCVARAGGRRVLARTGGRAGGLRVGAGGRAGARGRRGCMWGARGRRMRASAAQADDQCASVECNNLWSPFSIRAPSTNYLGKVGGRRDPHCVAQLVLHANSRNAGRSPDRAAPGGNHPDLVESGRAKIKPIAVDFDRSRGECGLTSTKLCSDFDNHGPTLSGNRLHLARFRPHLEQIRATSATNFGKTWR